MVRDQVWVGTFAPLPEAGSESLDSSLTGHGALEAVHPPRRARVPAAAGHCFTAWESGRQCTEGQGTAVMLPVRSSVSGRRTGRNRKHP